MSKIKVVVTDDRYGSYDIEREILRSVDAEIEVYNFLSQEEAPEKLKEAHAVLMNCFDMNRNIIQSLENCRVISRYGVGFDNVDVDAASEKRIWVANVPDYAIEDVSDHALGLLLCCIRKIRYKDQAVRSGRWNVHDEQKCFRIRGKTLGIIGHGHIGRAFHRKVRSLGLGKILICDPYIDAASVEALGSIPASLKTVIKESDYISVHVPLTEETRHFLSRAEFSAMKNHVIIINTSRGPVLDEEAVIWALQNGEIGYAGLDVFETEPLPDSSPLKTMDNVILTDHAGWYNEESVVELKSKAAKNIVSVFTSGKPEYPVNNL